LDPKKDSSNWGYKTILGFFTRFFKRSFHISWGSWPTGFI